MKILFTSYHLRSLNMDLEPVEFETAPREGDRVQIDHFVNPEEKKLIVECLESQKRITSGEVGTRVWLKRNNETILMINLFFEKYSEPTEPFAF